MTECSAFGCTNRNNKQKPPGLTFHRYPKDPKIRKAWEVAVRREGFKASNYSVLCSQHFNESDFDKSSPFVTLIKPGVVPSVFPGIPERFQKQSKERRPVKRHSDVSIIINSAGSSKIKKMDRLEKHIAKVQCQSEKTINDLKGVLEERSEEIKELRLQCSNLKQERLNTAKFAKCLKQQNQRLQQKVFELSSVVKKMKENDFIDEEQEDFLEGISRTASSLVTRQVVKVGNPSMKSVYDEQLRAFAITLNFLSPKAYNFVRREFDNCLPHPRTISGWYQTIDGSPGFSTEAFRTLKLRSQSSQQKIICALAVDCISIRQKKEWDANENQFYGTVNYGIASSSDNVKLATKAVFFLLTSINSVWKLPLGYFLVDSISGEQLHTLTNQLLHLLSDCDVIVTSITSDGAGENKTMARRLGCSLKPPIATSFVHEGGQSSFVFDVCHMIKLVRNTLHDLGTLQNEKGEFIQWAYIVNLLKLQEHEGMKLGNKLTKTHVYYFNQKMKVRLAAQLLSASIGDALTYCAIKKIPGFEGCEATVEFIKIFNRLFDILNSRSINAKFDKKALCPENINSTLSFFEKAEKYIRGLKEESGTPICESSRQTGFLGFLVAMTSVVDIYKYVVAKNKWLKYLPTYKLSQDHLERFFGYIRSRGGHNNNPSAKELQYIMKKIIIHKQLHEGSSHSGNAIPLDHILILRPSENSFKKINYTTSPGDLLTFDDHEVSIGDELSDHDYRAINGRCLTEFSCDVVQYIAGFVVRKAAKKIKCNQCIEAVWENNTLVPMGLIPVKQRGGLITPSHSVTQICLICEKIVRQAIQLSVLERQGEGSLMKQKALANCAGRNIFSNDHLKNGIHAIWLIQFIIDSYINIRMHSICKAWNNQMHFNSKRQFFNNLVQFKGQ